MTTDIGDSAQAHLWLKHRLKPQWDFKIYPPKLAKIKNSHKTMR